MDSPPVVSSLLNNRAAIPAVASIVDVGNNDKYFEQISVEVEKWLKFDQQCNTYMDPSHYYTNCDEEKLQEKLKTGTLQILRDLTKELNERSWMYEKKKKFQK